MLTSASGSALDASDGSEVHMNENSHEETLLTPGEVAARFRVDPKTVTRWANAGKLTAVRTLGGHRRYRRSEVDELLVANGLGAGMTTDAVR